MFIIVKMVKEENDEQIGGRKRRLLIGYRRSIQWVIIYTRNLAQDR